jgi:SPW repeat
MKWAGWTNVLLGLWLIAAPFALAYAGVTTAVYEDVEASGS